ncbi:MAG: methyltransferase domain-containing protein, partial [Gammaproteobacteria bacterium]
WSVLKHHPSTILHAADFNIAMLSVGLEKCEPHLTATMQGTVTSAFNLPFPDNSFDSIFCLRFIHHINLPDERLQLLRELARVTTTTVCISNWVVETGIKAKRLLRKEQTRKPGKHYDKFVMRHDQLLQEFSTAGFTVIDYTDLLPHLSSWRLYVLRKEQATSIAAPSITEYVCPVCKGALEHMLNPAQFICQHDKLAFPIHGKLPMLTQRDAITLD